MLISKRPLPTVFAVAVILLIQIVAATPACSEVDIGLLKARHLLKLPKYVEWPPKKFTEDKRVIFCSLGRDSWFKSLARIEREVSDPEILVSFREVDRLTRLGDCHILVVSRADTHRLENILDIAKRKAILTVSEDSRFLDKGVAVSFFVEAENVGFEINRTALKESGLQVSFRVLQLARLRD